jgi:hypothetical protein
LNKKAGSFLIQKLRHVPFQLYFGQQCFATSTHLS